MDPKILVETVKRVAEAFQVQPHEVEVSFRFDPRRPTEPFTWCVEVESPNRDRRVKLPHRTNGLGDTLAEAEAVVLSRAQFHRAV